MSFSTTPPWSRGERQRHDVEEEDVVADAPLPREDVGLHGGARATT